MYKSKTITGSDWLKTFAAKQKRLEDCLYTEGTPEQQVVLKTFQMAKILCASEKLALGKHLSLRRWMNTCK
jgi:hypothetical protein